MPLETMEVDQATELAPVEEHQTDEQRYHADIARLEAALQAAEDRYDQAEQAVWVQAQRYAVIQAIDVVGGFQRRSITPPSETCEQRWRDTPKKEQEALERLVKTRAEKVVDIERARAAIRQRQVQWGQACAEAAFLTTPEAQFLTRDLEETLAALEAAKASNQSDMVGVLARKRDSVEKQLVSARREWHASGLRNVQRAGMLAMQEADHRAREKRGV